MSVHQPSHSVHPELAASPGGLLSSTAGRALAVLRISTGFVFLWAFLDKTFGLGYATTSSHAWVNGGSPTKGFLASVAVGPMRSPYHAMAGSWAVDWLFMLGLLGIGVALVLGVGLRITAAGGVALMALMWLAEYPLARHTTTGSVTQSTNPIVDDHVVYAIVLVVLALSYSGSFWGLGRRWAQLPFVQRHRWLT